MADASSLDRLQNLRDLGGLRTEDGGVTRHGVLFRADEPLPGDRTPDEVAAWPFQHVVDLRNESEYDGAPHPYIEAGSVVHAVPMLTTALGPDKDWTAHFDQLHSIYEAMLEQGVEAITTAITVAARATGPILVHCGTGKDRTGVVLGVMLRAAGVGREAIAADYSRSQENLDRVYARRGIFPDRGDPVHRPKYDIAPAALENALDVVERHGGVAGWLTARGLDESVLYQWRRRFVEHF